MGYQWRFDVVWSYKEALLRGLVVTIEVSLVSFVLGALLGLMLCAARMSRRPVLRVPAICIMEVLRATPLLVQLLWVFYALPIILGFALSSIASIIVGLSMHTAVYMSEIFRAGIESIAPGQIEAGRSLGMSRLLTFLRIVLPQALRRMIPPIINEFTLVLKGSTLAAVLTVNELLHAAQNLIINTFRPLEFYTIVAVLFLAVILPISVLARHVEQLIPQRHE